MWGRLECVYVHWFTGLQGMRREEVKNAALEVIITCGVFLTCFWHGHGQISLEKKLTNLSKLSYPGKFFLWPVIDVQIIKKTKMKQQNENNCTIPNSHIVSSDTLTILSRSLAPSLPIATIAYSNDMGNLYGEILMIWRMSLIAWILSISLSKLTSRHLRTDRHQNKKLYSDH